MQIRVESEVLVAAVREREAALLAELERLADGKDLSLAAQEGQTVARRRDLEALVSSAEALVGGTDVAVAEGGAALVRRTGEVLRLQGGFLTQPCAHADMAFTMGGTSAVIQGIQGFGEVFDPIPDPDKTEVRLPYDLGEGRRSTITCA
jgi:hypothetical protein